MCRVPQSNWVIARKTHEPIIDEETFRTVQKLTEDTCKEYCRRAGKAGCPDGFRKSEPSSTSWMSWICRRLARLSSQKLPTEFHEAVDDYLEFCAETCKEPQKEYSSLFNVCIPPELHKKISILAQAEGVSLNKAVEQAIRAMVQSE